MNERIKELAACVKARLKYDDRDQKFDQKFAESIVAEVIAVLQKRFMGDLNREDMEVRRCIADVKKHFGDKE